MKIRVALDPTWTAAIAIRRLLADLLNELRSNAQRILDDGHPECVHDFRVAVRRTRSAIGQIRGVLPRGPVKHFRSEFKWLGTVTGRLRDLDVFLFDVTALNDEQKCRLEGADRLLPMIGDARRKAHLAVCEALNSPRFSVLLSDWSAFLDHPTRLHSRPPNADTEILELASKRILRAHRKVVECGAGLPEEPTPEALHRLRIDFKKLRYLLEFFGSLYPEEELAPLVAELKQIQDILGGISDTAVQQRLSTSIIAGPAAQDLNASAARTAANHLIDILAAGQRQHIAAFARRFAVFTDKNSRARYRSLFSPHRSLT